MQALAIDIAKTLPTWAEAEWRRKSSPTVIRAECWFILIKAQFLKHTEEKCSPKDPPLHGRCNGWPDVQPRNSYNCKQKEALCYKPPCRSAKPASSSQERWLGTPVSISELRKGGQKAVLIPKTVI